jgi:hypothetical protein
VPSGRNPSQGPQAYLPGRSGVRAVKQVELGCVSSGGTCRREHHIAGLENGRRIPSSLQPSQTFFALPVFSLFIYTSLPSCPTNLTSSKTPSATHSAGNLSRERAAASSLDMLYIQTARRRRCQKISGIYQVSILTGCAKPILKAPIFLRLSPSRQFL